MIFFFFGGEALVSISSIFLTWSYDKYFFSNQERMLTQCFAIYGISGGVFLT